MKSNSPYSATCPTVIFLTVGTFFFFFCLTNCGPLDHRSTVHVKNKIQIFLPLEIQRSRITSRWKSNCRRRATTAPHWRLKSQPDTGPRCSVACRLLSFRAIVFHAPWYCPVKWSVNFGLGSCLAWAGCQASGRAGAQK